MSFRTYRVTVHTVLAKDYLIPANNPEEAEQKALERLFYDSPRVEGDWNDTGGEVSRVEEEDR